MRVFLFLLLASFTFTTANAQIKGNGKRATETRMIDNINKVSIDINGKVNIYCGSKESKIEISYDENILEYVASSKRAGILVLDQKQWISGTEEVEINIYTNQLNVLKNDSWSKINVYDINQDKMTIQSNISDVKLAGKVNDLNIISEDSNIYAYDLETRTAKVKITENGKVYINASQSVDGDIKEDGEIFYKGNPSASGITANKEKEETKTTIDTRYIDLKFKNNSFSRIQCFVKGPKPDGNYFSYGLPFSAMRSRAERWTIGTKLYRVNKLGIRTLLHVVTAEDEGKEIPLFKDK